MYTYFITNTHKLSNMILEIKPYHVDIKIETNVNSI